MRTRRSLASGGRRASGTRRRRRAWPALGSWALSGQWRGSPRSWLVVCHGRGARRPRRPVVLCGLARFSRARPKCPRCVVSRSVTRGAGTCVTWAICFVPIQRRARRQSRCWSRRRGSPTLCARCCLRSAAMRPCDLGSGVPPGNGPRGPHGIRRRRASLTNQPTSAYARALRALAETQKVFYLKCRREAAESTIKNKPRQQNQ